jgi:hypothetical protein
MRVRCERRRRGSRRPAKLDRCEGLNVALRHDIALSCERETGRLLNLVLWQTEERRAPFLPSLRSGESMPMHLRLHQVFDVSVETALVLAGSHHPSIARREFIVTRARSLATRDWGSRHRSSEEAGDQGSHSFAPKFTRAPGIGSRFPSACLL